MKKIFCLSSTKEIFEKLKDCYQQCLQQCGYNEKLNYMEENHEINKKSRKQIVFGSTDLTANQ